MYLSIIVPCFNEAKNLPAILSKLIDLKLPENFSKEIIVINDKSTDNSLEILQSFAAQHNFITILNNPFNLGKSQSVKKGILASKGDWVVIQDADLEYEPEDFVFILEQVLKHNCDVGYGNRFGLYNGVIYWQNFLGNLFLSFFSNLFTIWKTRVFIPDMEVCYKLVRGEIFRELAKDIVSKSNFGFEPEITAKLSKYKKGQEYLKFIILPIRYNPRSFAEGKKMKAFRDGFKALIEIIKYNLF